MVLTVAVLPDEAVENLIAKGVLDEVPAEDGVTGTEDDSSELVERNGEAVYKVNGTRHMKFFGIIPVDVPVTAYVSAEDGTPTEEELSFLSRMIDFLSL